MIGRLLGVCFCVFASGAASAAGPRPLYFAKPGTRTLLIKKGVSVRGNGITLTEDPNGAGNLLTIRTTKDRFTFAFERAEAPNVVRFQPVSFLPASWRYQSPAEVTRAFAAPGTAPATFPAHLERAALGDLQAAAPLRARDPDGPIPFSFDRTRLRVWTPNGRGLSIQSFSAQTGIMNVSIDPADTRVLGVTDRATGETWRLTLQPGKSARPSIL